MFPLHDSDVPLESYELRVTLVWAPLASVVHSPLTSEKMKINKLKEWEKQEVIPDVIVVGESIFSLVGEDGRLFPTSLLWVSPFFSSVGEDGSLVWSGWDGLRLN